MVCKTAKCWSWIGCTHAWWVYAFVCVKKKIFLENPHLKRVKCNFLFNSSSDSTPQCPCSPTRLGSTWPHTEESLSIYHNQIAPFIKYRTHHCVVDVLSLCLLAMNASHHVWEVHRLRKVVYWAQKYFIPYTYFFVVTEYVFQDKKSSPIFLMQLRSLWALYLFLTQPSLQLSLPTYSPYTQLGFLACRRLPPRARRGYFS